MEYKDEEKAVTRRELKEDIAITESKFEERFKEMLAKIDHLPTKDEFFAAQDKLMLELKAIRQEQGMFLNGQDRHEKRIVRLEDHVGIGLPVSF
ncbi:MAG: hypothetical protein Q7S48_00875 [bacterium]|nr:hypothetical protein [bacterium]